jgi:hypothetical protein
VYRPVYGVPVIIYVIFAQHLIKSILLLLLLLLLLLEFIRLGPTMVLTNAEYETVGPANYDRISSSLTKLLYLIA